MDPHGHANPRAHGKRLPFKEVSPDVHEWLRVSFGDIEVVHEYSGGLSPGCAASIVTEHGRLLFVKAAAEHDQDATASLFRHEAHVLSALPAASYRPELLGVYDSNGWVALVIDHIEGGYPDLTARGDMDQVASVLKIQGEELSPPPRGLSVASLGECVHWWVPRWEQIIASPCQFLPEWAVELAEDGEERLAHILDSLPDDTVCHFDIRNDNLLVNEDTLSVTFLDWGIAMTGPKWVDFVILSLQAETPMESDAFLRDWIDDSLQDVVTDFIVVFGGSQSWDSKLPPPPRQPTLRKYLADDAARLLRLGEFRTR